MLRFSVDEYGKEILEMVTSSSVDEGNASSSGPDTQKRRGRKRRRASTEEASIRTPAPAPYKGSNTVVMMEWERPLMQACVDALRVGPSCDVLEIGFGCGYSATHIQAKSPRTHVIVECDPVVLQRAHTWSKGRPGVSIVEGRWQAVVHRLGRFDCIFFDDFPLPPTDSTSSGEGDGAGGGAGAGAGAGAGVDAAATITAAVDDDSDLRSCDSRWHAFLDLCAAWHMKRGARLGGYLARRLQLCRSDCHVTMQPLHVKVPPNCPYFHGDTAYVPVITFTGLPGPAATAGGAGPSASAAVSLRRGDGSKDALRRSVLSRLGLAQPATNSAAAVAAPGGDSEAEQLQMVEQFLQQRAQAKTAAAVAATKTEQSPLAADAPRVVPAPPPVVAPIRRKRMKLPPPRHTIAQQVET